MPPRHHESHRQVVHDLLQPLPEQNLLALARSNPRSRPSLEADNEEHRFQDRDEGDEEEGPSKAPLEGFERRADGKPFGEMGRKTEESEDCW